MLDFVFRHHVIHRPGMNSFPSWFQGTLREDDRAQPFWREGSFDYGERILLDAGELDRYYTEFVEAHRPPRRARAQQPLYRLADRIA